MKIDVRFLTIPTLKLKKHYAEELKIIDAYVLENNEEKEFDTVKQKIYNYINNINKIPVCKECNKNNLSFKGTKEGYTKFCSVKCKANSESNKNNVKNTLQEKYGVSNVSQLESVKKSKNETFEKKYGNANPFIAFREKIEATWMRNYGVKNPSYSKKIKDKISKANKLNKKTRVEKLNATILRKYNVNNIALLKDNKKDSIIENKLRDVLGGIKKVIKHKEFDIVLEKLKIIIEVDGVFYHPTDLSNLSLIQINNVVNDIDKEKRLKGLGYTLIRIRDSIIENFINDGVSINIELIKINAYTPNRLFDNIENVLSHDKLLHYFEKLSKKEFDFLISRLRLLLKYIKGINSISNKKFLKKFYGVELDKQNILDEILRHKNEVQYSTILCAKDFIIKQSKEKINSELEDIFLFIRKNIKKFIYPTTTETLHHIFSRINKIAWTPIFGKIFKNNISSSGNEYLKSIFKSYYNSSYKGNKTPVECFEDDKLVRSVLKYRLGINNTGEVFDLSFKQILKGFSAIRKTISFFKPSTAAMIYHNFLKNKKKIVFDPCCGFGGRMLGFFILYPHGQYIGCEPNSETFAELYELKSKLSGYYGFEIDCRLFNQTLEQFVKTKEWNEYKNLVNLTFTSIPYYDKEIYSKDVVGENYSSFEDWKEKFISCFLQLPNCYVNLSQELFDRLNLNSLDTYYLKNNVARHLNKKDKEKIELIVKLT